MNIGNLINPVAAAILEDFKQKMRAVLTERMPPGPQTQQIIDITMQNVDEAIKRVGAGAATLTVQVNGGSPAAVAQPNFNAAGLTPGFNPLGGAPIQQFGGQMAQAAPPKPATGSVSTLRECGVPGQTCRIPGNMPLPPGALCGCEAKFGGVTGFCTALAKEVGKSGYYTCAKHKTRQSIEGGKGGKKSNPVSGQGAVISQQQIFNAAKTPVASNIPGVFASNPFAQQNLASMMQQQPAYIGQNPLQGAYGAAQPNNPQQSLQLMNSMTSAASQIPAGLSVMNPNPQHNFGALINQPAPTSAVINQGGFNPLQQPGGFNPAQNPFGGQTVQINPMTVPAGGNKGLQDDDDDDNQNSDDSDDEGSESANSGSNPIPFQNAAALQNALQAATVPGLNPLISNPLGAFNPALGGMQNNPLVQQAPQNNPLQNNPLQAPQQMNPLQNNPLVQQPVQMNPLQNNPLQAPQQVNPLLNNPLVQQAPQTNPLQAPQQVNPLAQQLAQQTPVPQQAAPSVSPQAQAQAQVASLNELQKAMALAQSAQAAVAAEAPK